MRYACLSFSSFRNLSPTAATATAGKSERLVQRDADFTVLERSEHIAERVRLADLKSPHDAAEIKVRRVFEATRWCLGDSQVQYPQVDLLQPRGPLRGV
jgi:hypothetical protein